ncbi:hypothetical protein F5Y18DRAFT_425974 [Xylariaceae sp. FL1019]|nr:hypothetical protein F5Y18DRAFT_425974 [Xylariaceae sp. FL1019]
MQSRLSFLAVASAAIAASSCPDGRGGSSIMSIPAAGPETTTNDTPQRRCTTVPLTASDYSERVGYGTGGATTNNPTLATTTQEGSSTFDVSSSLSAVVFTSTADDSSTLATTSTASTSGTSFSSSDTSATSSSLEGGTHLVTSAPSLLWLAHSLAVPCPKSSPKVFVIAA